MMTDQKFQTLDSGVKNGAAWKYLNSFYSAVSNSRVDLGRADANSKWDGIHQSYRSLL